MVRSIVSGATHPSVMALFLIACDVLKTRECLVVVPDTCAVFSRPEQLNRWRDLVSQSQYFTNWALWPLRQRSEWWKTWHDQHLKKKLQSLTMIKNSDKFGQLWQFLTILTILTIFDNFWHFSQCWQFFWQFIHFFTISIILYNCDNFDFTWRYLTLLIFLTALTILILIILTRILVTRDIWDTDYNSDNWEAEFMTIFVTLLPDS